MKPNRQSLRAMVLLAMTAAAFSASGTAWAETVVTDPVVSSKTSTGTSIETIDPSANTRITGDNAMPSGGSASSGVTIHPITDNYQDTFRTDVHQSGLEETTRTNHVIQDSTLKIDQTSERAIIKWNSFNVGKNSSVIFNQTRTLNYTDKETGTTSSFKAANPFAMTLNVVADTGGLSEIAGHIKSNGTFLLTNPNGVMFTEGSSVDAAGIVVSTAKLHEDEFLNSGTIHFYQNGTTNGNILVNGSLNASTDTVLKAAQTSLDAANKVLGKTALNLSDITVGTSFSQGNNVINLVADGDIAVGEKGSLSASETAIMPDTRQAGAESFNIRGQTISKEGSIVMHADNNADEMAVYDARIVAQSGITDTGDIKRYNETGKDPKTSGTNTVDTGSADGQYKVAKVYLNNDVDSGHKISAQHVSVYYEPDITSAGVNGTSASAVGISDDQNKTFTQKDYTTFSADNQKLNAKVEKNPTITISTVDDAGNLTESTTSSASQYRNYAMLVNDVYQLQAIEDSKELSEANHIADTGYYGNLAGSYVLGRSISAADTQKWNPDTLSVVNADGTSSETSIHRGFNPIGDADHPFTGSITGSAGIYDLTINRPDEDYVGLFAAMNHGGAWSVTMVDSSIRGKDYTGTVVGEMVNGSELNNVIVRKRDGSGSESVTVKGTEDNVRGEKYTGGLAGSMTDSKITNDSVNASTVTGTTAVGGLAGRVNGSSVISDARNVGYTSAKGNLETKVSEDDSNPDKGSTVKTGVITGVTDVGGLVGQLGGDSTIKTQWTNARTYNSGQVYGHDNVGGLVGSMGDSASVIHAYNTNEAANGTAHISSEEQVGNKSVYGKVQSDAGGSNTGGLVGKMSGNSSVDMAYNAGNVSGDSSVGGLAGAMTDQAKITRAYNGDNNTVLLTAKGNHGDSSTTAGAEAEGAYVGFTVKNADGQGNNINGIYSYDVNTLTWTRVVKDDAGNIISETDNIPTQNLPDPVYRINNNRLAYRDATVTGSSQVGGLVGTVSGGSVTQAYNQGQVTGVAADTTGTVAGMQSGGTLGDGTQNSILYVTKDESTGRFLTDGTNKDGTLSAVGEGTGGTQSIKALTRDEISHSENIGWADSSGTALDQDNTQNSDWVVNRDSTAPLLKNFMNTVNINRQYRYNGTMHSLITSDVDNYYGGAFFSDGVSGKDVYNGDASSLVKNYNAADWVIKSGDSTDVTEHSSVYTYDKSSLWSPQMGYYTKGQAQLLIAAEPVTVTVSATKTYGQITKGYIYHDMDADKYYTYNDTTGNWAISQTLPEAGAKYVVTVTGLSNQEKPLDVLKNLNIIFISAEDGTTISSGTSGLANAGSDKENAATTVGEYKLTVGGNVVGKDTVRTNENYNYQIDYQGKLIVNKADLYYSASGERAYGSNNQGTIHLSAKVSGSSGEDALNNGSLKSFDNQGDHAGTAIDLTKLEGFTNLKGNDYTLIADSSAKNTKNGVIGESTVIDEGTWVNGSVGSTSYSAYTLGQGSFLTKDGEGNDISQFTSTNYNLIYDGNKETKAVNSGRYTITPISLQYDIEGSHTYGSQPTGKATLVDTDKKLVNGDTMDNVISHGNADELVQNTLAAEHITESTHVRVSDGQYNEVYWSGTIGSDTSEATAAALTPNYVLTARNLDYKIYRAPLTVKAGTGTREYGADNSTLTYGPVDIQGLLDVNGDKTNLAADKNYFVSGLADNSITTATGVNRDTSGQVISYQGKTSALLADSADTSHDGSMYSDYQITYERGDVKITPASLHVRAGDGSRVYGDDNSTTRFTAVTFTNPSEFKNADASTLGGTAGAVHFTSSLKEDTILSQTTEAGNYSDQTTAGLNETDKSLYNNYSLTFEDGDAQITARPLYYKVDNVTSTYGQTPVFSGSFSNYVNGDNTLTTPQVAQGEYSVSGDGSNQTELYKSDAGAYTVTADATALKNRVEAWNSNYTVITNGESAPVVNGTWTVGKADLYFTANGSREYGDKNHLSDMTLKAITRGDAADDADNLGQLKSWDLAASDDLVHNLAGFTGTSDGTVTLVSSENVRQGTTSPLQSADGTATGQSLRTDHNINESSWVKNSTWDKDSAGTPEAYTLAEGSFSSNGNAELSSRNYNLIFKGGNAADGTAGEYTITPATLTYNVSGQHTYGQAVDAKYDVTGTLKNGDALYNVFAKNGLDEKAKDTVEAAGIVGNTGTNSQQDWTHVKRDSQGRVIAVIDNGNAPGTTTVTDLTPNYVLKAGKLTYTVNPAEAVYTVNANSKTYGKTVLDSAATGVLSLADGSGTSVYDAATGAFTSIDDVQQIINGKQTDSGVIVDDTTKKNILQVKYTYDTSIKDKTGNESIASSSTELNALAHVNREKTGETPNAYHGVIKGDGLYLNDYNVSYQAGDLTINPAALQVKADTAQKTYGDASFATGNKETFQGFVNGDESQLGGTAGDANFNTFVSDKNAAAYRSPDGASGSLDFHAADSKQSAGAYTGVSHTVLNTGKESLYSDYDISYETNNALVDQKKLVYQVGDVERKYGGNTDFRGHYAGVVDGDVVGSADGTETSEISQSGYQVRDAEGQVLSAEELTRAHTGTYDITADASVVADEINNSNYKLDGVQDGKLSIQKAKLYFTANGQRKYAENNTLDTLQLTARAGDAASDSEDTGSLKSWDSGKATDITGLTGFKTVNVQDGMHLVSSEMAKNGADSESTDIDSRTWVKGSSNAVEAYSLGSGSFMQNGSSQLVSQDYDLVYAGNAGGETSSLAAGTYTIEPVNLTVNADGTHVYGQRASDSYTMSADSSSMLRNGDTIDDVVNQEVLNHLAHSAAVAAGLDKGLDTHVKRDSTGAVQSVSYNQVMNDELTAHKDNYALDKTPNYVISGGTLTYRVTPATATYTADSRTKIYGNAVLEPDVHNTGTWSFHGTGNLASVYEDSSARANVMTPTSFINDAAVMDTHANVRYENGHVAAYKGAVSMSHDLYLNDYNVEYVNGDITVNPAVLTVTAGAGTRIYGESNSTIHYDPVTLTGFKNQDAGNIQINNQGNFTSSMVTGTADDASSAGTYRNGTEATITGDSSLYGNYTLQYKNNDLTIEKRKLSYVVEPSDSTYGTKGIFSGHFTNIAPVDSSRTDKFAPVAQEGFTVTDQAGRTVSVEDRTHAGSYHVTAERGAVNQAILDSGNYVLDQDDAISGNTFTVNKKALRLTAGSAENTVYGERPEYSPVVVEGLAEGDSIADAVTGLTTVSDGYSHGRTGNVGTVYTTQVAYDGDSGNYDISAHSGILTYVPRDLTITAGSATTTYGDAPVYSPVLVRGIANGDKEADVLQASKTTRSRGFVDGRTGDVNTYETTTDGNLLSGNYRLIFENGRLVVQKAVLDVVAGNGSRMYGDSNDSFTYTPVTFHGFRYGEEQTLGGNDGARNFSTTLSSSSGITEKTHATGPSVMQGTTRAEINPDKAEMYRNYNFNYIPGDAVITSAPLWYTANDNTRIMGMSELITPNSGYYHGYRNGDSVTGAVSYHMNTNARSIAGTYAGDIVPMGPAYIGGNGYDYRMIYVPGTMQVRNNTTYDNAAEAARDDRRKNMEWIKSSTTSGGQIRAQDSEAERYLTLEGTVVSLNKVQEHTGRIVVGDMEQMTDHAGHSIENMGKQLYAEGTAPVAEGTTISTVTPAKIIENADKITAENRGIPFYRVTKDNENQLYGTYAILSGKQGINLVPAQPRNITGADSENQLRTADVSLTLHYRMGRFHLEYNGSSLIVSPMDESAVRLVEQNTSASSARELLALSVNSAMHEMDVIPENLDAVYLNTQMQ